MIIIEMLYIIKKNKKQVWNEMNNIKSVADAQLCDVDSV